MAKHRIMQTMPYYSPGTSLLILEWSAFVHR